MPAVASPPQSSRHDMNGANPREWLWRRTPAWVCALLVAGGVSLKATAVVAQDASVQGIVLDEETAQPLQGVEVVLERADGIVRSTLTNRHGLYQITRIPPGTYRLRMRVLGYTSHEESIDLGADEVRRVNRRLGIAPVELEGLSVRGQGPGAVRRELGVQTIMADQLAQIPTPAASGDLMSYLQTQPGVVGSGDRGGQLFIRGGTPSENLVLMDGMPIYQPFHITGLFSVFPENLMQSAAFHAGGFGPQYSGRMSSVLDVQMRDGNRNRGSITASVSPFLADASAEGPLLGGRGSYIVSARRSLIRETSPWLLGEEQPVGFDSQYLRLSYLNEAEDSRCSFTVLRSRDEGGLDPEDRVSRVGWRNLLVGGRCVTLAGETFMDVRWGRTAVSSEAVTRGASEFFSSTSRLFVDADVSRMLSRSVRLNWGGAVHVDWTAYDLREMLTENALDGVHWPGASMYAELDIPIGGGVRVLPGAILSVAREQSPRVEPRLRAAWGVPGLTDAELSGAVGVYEQALSGISDRRDASSVFTAWVRTPHGSRMRSVHAQASWSHGIGDAFSYSVDGFVRRMSDLPVSAWSTVARFAPVLTVATGRSHGADARVEYRRGPIYLFGGYAFSRTEYRSEQEDFGILFGDPVLVYNPGHDRRHQATALASLVLGRFTLSALWDYGSGFPFTRPMGFYEWIDFRTDRTGLPSPRRAFGTSLILVDLPYSGRLPSTHRMDLSVKRTVPVRGRDLELQAGVINVYDRTNMFYYDLFADRRVDQLPLAPFVSVQLELPTRP
jgi:hypothetical protein